MLPLSPIHSYDQDGNLISDGNYTYTYDPENRLLSAKPSGASKTTYSNDPKGRRAIKAKGSTTTNFLDDGDDEIAEYDGSGTLLRRFVPGPAIDEPIAEVTGGAYEYFHTDHHGSVIVMSDSTGAQAEGAFTYDSYGNSNCSGSGGVPFRYTGQYLDPETCLYYYRARYYSPLIGRFLQVDPVGYAADMDLYTYVANDPTNMTDPLGLCDDSNGPCIDHTAAQTLGLLNMAYGDATAGPKAGLQNIYSNSTGRFDFGYNARTAGDTWTYQGNQMSAAQMGNFVAGFEGAAYDKTFVDGFPFAESLVEYGGLSYHLQGATKAKNDPFDRTGMPDIKKGESAGKTFVPSKSGSGRSGSSNGGASDKPGEKGSGKSVNFGKTIRMEGTRINCPPGQSTC